MKDFNACATVRSLKPRRHGSELATAEAPNIEASPARASGGNSSNGLGGEPRGPNNVRSSHNAVILASAASGFQVGTSVLSLLWKAPRAKQRFGESTLHFVLQQGERVLSGRPWRSCVGRTAKSGADPHKARGAHDRWRANGERGEALEELTPRDDKRPHPRNPPALADEYTQPVVAFRRRQQRRPAPRLLSLAPDLAALSGFVDIPNRGSSEQRR